MNDTNKIAEERFAEVWFWNTDHSDEALKAFKQAFRAAIEKALAQPQWIGEPTVEERQRNQSRAAAHASEQLIDEIVGDLVRETNIFPSQVQRAKELIRERLNVKQKVMDAGLKKVEK